MVKKRILFLFVAILLVCVLPPYFSTTHYGISDGFYRMETEEDGLAPYVHFDMEDGKTSFVLGVENISYSCYGSVELDGRVNLLGYTGEKWVFEVVDNNTLRFDAENSDTDSFVFPDGALFLYEKK